MTRSTRNTFMACLLALTLAPHAAQDDTLQATAGAMREYDTALRETLQRHSLEAVLDGMHNVGSEVSLPFHVWLLGSIVAAQGPCGLQVDAAAVARWGVANAALEEAFSDNVLNFDLLKLWASWMAAELTSLDRVDRLARCLVIRRHAETLGFLERSRRGADP